MVVGVSEAATALGVSRQRVLQLIADRRLRAERVGRVWAIDEVELARHRAPVGRPLSSAMAGAFLQLAAGRRPDVGAREVERLRDRMTRLVGAVDSGDDVAGLLRSWLPRRAERLELSVADADLAEVGADARLVLSGLSDPRAGMSAARVVEGYVRESDAAAFHADHFAVPSNRPGHANLVVHVAPLVPPVSAVLVAADLSDHRGVREDRQAREVLAQWFASDGFDADLLLGGRRP